MSHSDFTKSLRINREHWRTNRLFQETFSYLALKLKTSMNWTKNMTNVLARQCNFSYGFQNMYDSIYIIPTSFKYCWEKYGKTCIILHKIYFDVSTTDMLLYVVFFSINSCVCLKCKHAQVFPVTELNIYLLISDKIPDVLIRKWIKLLILKCWLQIVSITVCTVNSYTVTVNIASIRIFFNNQC